MTETLTISKFRSQLLKLPKKLAREKKPGTITVTQRGKPVLAVLPYDFYDSLMETLEVMSDPELMAALRQSAKEIKQGRGIPLEQMKKDLDL